MANIDERVVQMTFDNKQFEAAIKESQKTLESLKNSLIFENSKKNIEELKKSFDFTDATKSLDKIENKVNSFNLDHIENSIDKISNQFTLLGRVGAKIMDDIANSTVNAAKKMAKSLTTDQMSAGMNKYEIRTRAVQTITNATGKTVEDVEKVLERLAYYTDMTSYDFAEMVSSIGKFTSVGVDLEVAELAMEGIANEAAVSGAGIQEANRAMYNFAQSLSAGYVKLIDWKSIENANMATKEFKQQLIDMAISMGTLVDKGNGVGAVLTQTKQGVREDIVSYQSFNETLKQEWLTSDVLIATLAQYGDATTAIGKKAYEAAKDALTFTDAMNAIKDAISSGWMTTFTYLFGNLDESIKLWTGFCDAIIEVTSQISEYRNAVLQVWHDGIDGVSGYTMALEGISNLWSAFTSILYSVRDAFNELIPPMTGEALIVLTAQFRDATAAIADFFHYTDTSGVEVETEIDVVTSKIENLNSVIEKGAKGESVKELQKVLIDAGYSLDKFGADGIYGPETEAALKDLQKDLGVQETGIWDEATIKAAQASDKFKKTTKKTTTEFKEGYVEVEEVVEKVTNKFDNLNKNLKVGMKTSEVHDLQEALIDAGYALDKYGADGVYGAETEAAVRRLQRDLGVEETGIWDEATRQAALAYKKFQKVEKSTRVTQKKVGETYKTQREVTKEINGANRFFTEAGEAHGFETAADRSVERVKKLQQELQLAGYLSDTFIANGVYGPETQEAVKLLQKDLGTEMTGIFDENTLVLARDQGAFVRYVTTMEDCEEVVQGNTTALTALQGIVKAFVSVIKIVIGVIGVIVRVGGFIIKNVILPIGSALSHIAGLIGRLFSNFLEMFTQIEGASTFDLLYYVIESVLTPFAIAVQYVTGAIEGFFAKYPDIETVGELIAVLGIEFGGFFENLKTNFPIIGIIADALGRVKDAVISFIFDNNGKFVLIDNLKAKWQEFLQLPIVQKIGDIFNAIKNFMFNDTGRFILFDNIALKFNEMKNNVTSKVTEFISGVNAKFAEFRKNNPIIDKFLTGIESIGNKIGWFGRIFGTVFKNNFAWDKNLNPIENLKNAFGALQKAAGDVFSRIHKGMREFIESNPVLKAFSDTIGKIGNAFKNLVFNDKGKFALFDNIAARFTAFRNGIVAKITELRNNIVAKVSGFISTINGKIAEFRKNNPIFDNFLKTIEKIGDTLGWFGRIFGTVFGNNFSWDKNLNPIENLKNAFGALQKTSDVVFSRIRKSISDFVKSNPVLKAIGDTINRIGTAIRSFMFNDSGKFALIDNLKAKWQEFLKLPIIQKIGDIFKSVKNFTVGESGKFTLFDNIVAKFNEVRTKVATKIGGFVSGINSKFADFRKNNPIIDKLLKGIEGIGQKFAWFGRIFGTVFGNNFSWDKSLSPIENLKNAFGALQKASEVVFSRIRKGFRDFVQSNPVLKAFSDAITKVSSAVKNLMFDNNGKFALIDNLKAKWQEFLKLPIVSEIVKIVDKIRSLGSSFADIFSKNFKWDENLNFFQNIGNAFKAIGTAGKSVLTSIIDYFKTVDWAAVAEKIPWGSIARSVAISFGVSFIKNLFTKKGAVGAAFGAAGAIGGSGGGIIAIIAGGLLALYQSFKLLEKANPELFNKIKDAFDSFKKDIPIIGTITDAFSKFVDFFTIKAFNDDGKFVLFENILKKLGEVKDKIFEFIGSIFNPGKAIKEASKKEGSDKDVEKTPISGIIDFVLNTLNISDLAGHIFMLIGGLAIIKIVSMIGDYFAIAKTEHFSEIIQNLTWFVTALGGALIILSILSPARVWSSVAAMLAFAALIAAFVFILQKLKVDKKVFKGLEKVGEMVTSAMLSFVGIALSIIALSLVMHFIEPKLIFASIGAMALVLGALFGIMALMVKFIGKGNPADAANVAKALSGLCMGLVSIAASILLVTVAIDKFGGEDVLGALSIMLGALTWLGFVAVMVSKFAGSNYLHTGKKKQQDPIVSLCLGLIPIAIAIWIMTMTIDKYGGHDAVGALGIMASMLIVLGAIPVLVSALAKNDGKVNIKGLLKLCIGLTILSVGIANLIRVIRKYGIASGITALSGMVLIIAAIGATLVLCAKWGDKKDLKAAAGSFFIMCLGVMGIIMTIGGMLTYARHLSWQQLIPIFAGITLIVASLGATMAFIAKEGNDHAGRSVAASGAGILVASIGISLIVLAMSFVLRAAKDIDWKSLIPIFAGMAIVVAALTITMAYIAKNGNQHAGRSVAASGAGILVACIGITAVALAMAIVLKSAKKISWKALIPIFAGMALVVAALTITMAYIAKNGNQHAGRSVAASGAGILIACIGLAALAVSMSVIVKAAKRMDWKALAAIFAGMALIVAAIGKTMADISRYANNYGWGAELAAGGGIILACAGLSAFAIALTTVIKSAKGMDWKPIAAIFAGMAVVVAAIGKTMVEIAKHADKYSWGAELAGGGGIMLALAGLAAFCYGLQYVLIASQDLNWEHLALIFGGIAVIAIVLGATMSSISKNANENSAKSTFAAGVGLLLALGGLALFMWQLKDVVVAAKDLDWTQLLTLLGGIALIVAALGAVMAIMASNNGGSAWNELASGGAMLIAFAGIALLVYVMKETIAQIKDVDVWVLVTFMAGLTVIIIAAGVIAAMLGKLGLAVALKGAVAIFAILLAVALGGYVLMALGAQGIELIAGALTSLGSGLSMFESSTQTLTSERMADLKTAIIDNLVPIIVEISKKITDFTNAQTAAGALTPIGRSFFMFNESISDIKQEYAINLERMMDAAEYAYEKMTGMGLMALYGGNFTLFGSEIGLFYDAIKDIPEGAGNSLRNLMINAKFAFVAMTTMTDMVNLGGNFELFGGSLKNFYNSVKEIASDGAQGTRQVAEDALYSYNQIAQMTGAALKGGGLTFFGGGLKNMTSSLKDVKSDDISGAKQVAQDAKDIYDFITGIGDVTDYTDRVADLGAAIKLYYTELKDVKTVDDEGNEIEIDTDTISKVFTALAAAVPTDDSGAIDSITQFASKVGADSSGVTQFAIGITALGTALKTYGEDISGIDGDKVSTANTILEGVSDVWTKVVSAVPPEEAIKAGEGFAGEGTDAAGNNVGSFGLFIAGMSALGTAIKDYATDISGLKDSESDITVANSMLDKMSGIWAAVAGTKDNSGGLDIGESYAQTTETGDYAVYGKFGAFIAGIECLGSAIKSYATDISDLKNSEEDINTANGIIDRVKEIWEKVAGADFTGNQASTVESFADPSPGVDSDLQKFGKFGAFIAGIKALGLAIKEYCNSVSGIGTQTADIDAANGIIDKVADIQSTLTNDKISWTGLFGDEYFGTASDNSTAIGNFGNNISALGQAIGDYGNSVKDLKLDSIGKSWIVAQMVLNLQQSLPTTGGILGWLAGEQSLGLFSANLKSLGTGIADFDTETQGITMTEARASMLAVLIQGISRAATYLARTGGLLATVVGDESLSKFAQDLDELGAGMVAFENAVKDTEFSKGEDGKYKIAVISEFVKAFGLARQEIDAYGGWVSKVQGENSLENFGSDLVLFADKLNEFTTKTESANFDGFISVADSTEKLAAAITTIADSGSDLPTLGGYLDQIMKMFAGENNLFNNYNIGEFTGFDEKTLAGIDSFADGVALVLNKVSEKTENITVDNIIRFSEAFSTFLDSMDRAREFGANKDMAATNILAGVSQAISSFTTSIDKYGGAFTIGEGLDRDFALGLLENSGLVEGSAAAVAQAALDAMQVTIDARSPSAVTEQFGKWLDEGLILGLTKETDDVTFAGRDMVQSLINEIHDDAGIGSASWITDMFGNWLGEGFVNGLRGKVDDVKAAGANMVSSLFGQMDETAKKEADKNNLGEAAKEMIKSVSESDDVSKAISDTASNLVDSGIDGVYDMLLDKVGDIPIVGDIVKNNSDAIKEALLDNDLANGVISWAKGTASDAGASVLRVLSDKLGIDISSLGDLSPFGIDLNLKIDASDDSLFGFSLSDLDDTKEAISDVNTEIKRGMRGDAVRNMQSTLTKLGFELKRFGVDGIFGPETQAAVKAFQKAAGLEQTGIWTDLEEQAAKSGKVVAKTAHYQTAKDLKEAQQALIDMGYHLDKYGADGIYGEETEKAIKEFQKDMQIEESGIWDKDTDKAWKKEKKHLEEVKKAYEETESTLAYANEYKTIDRNKNKKSEKEWKKAAERNAFLAKHFGSLENARGLIGFFYDPEEKKERDEAIRAYEEDKKYTDDLMERVRNLQKGLGLEETGFIDEKTIVAMGNFDAVLGYIDEKITENKGMDYFGNLMEKLWNGETGSSLSKHNKAFFAYLDKLYPELAIADNLRERGIYVLSALEEAKKIPEEYAAKNLTKDKNIWQKAADTVTGFFVDPGKYGDQASKQADKMLEKVPDWVHEALPSIDIDEWGQIWEQLPVDIADKIAGYSDLPEKEAKKMYEPLIEMIWTYGRKIDDGALALAKSVSESTEKVEYATMMTEEELKAYEFLSKDSKIERATKDIDTKLVEINGDTYESARGKGYSLGEATVEGNTQAIEDNANKPADAMENVQKGVIKTAKDTVEVESPSKVLYWIGQMIMQGLVNGIESYRDTVKIITSHVVNGAVSAAQEGLAAVNTVINADINAQPVIRPVLDLSEVHKGIGSLGGVFGSGSYGLSVNGTRNLADQVGFKEAIDKLNVTENAIRVENAINGLSARVDELGQKVSTMRVVMNNGALVGEILPYIDRGLGQTAWM